MLKRLEVENAAVRKKRAYEEKQVAPLETSSGKQRTYLVVDDSGEDEEVVEHAL